MIHIFLQNSLDIQFILRNAYQMFTPMCHNKETNIYENLEIYTLTTNYDLRNLVPLF